MNNIELFKNESFGEVRTIIENEQVLFCAKDVASALGYSNTNKAINDHCKKPVMIWGNDSLGRQQETKFIPESDVYRLIVKSKLPQAEEFERWLFEEVLPSIRKHGGYLTPQKIEEALLNPDTLIQLATTLKEEQEKNKKLLIKNSELTVDNQIMKPKAEYFDELVDRNLLTNIRETAKQLKIGEKLFVKFLLDKKYLYRDKKGKLTPYADKNKGLFELKECFNEKTKWAGTQTLITPKGRETFRLLLL